MVNELEVVLILGVILSVCDNGHIYFLLHFRMVMSAPNL